MRRTYRARRAALVGALAQAAPHVRVAGLDAGLHVLLDLGPADERVVVERLARRGLLVTPLGDCRIAAGEGSGVLVGYGNLPATRIPAVAEAIASAVPPT